MNELDVCKTSGETLDIFEETEDLLDLVSVAQSEKKVMDWIPFAAADSMPKRSARVSAIRGMR